MGGQVSRNGNDIVVVVVVGPDSETPNKESSLVALAIAIKSLNLEAICQRFSSCERN